MPDEAPSRELLEPALRQATSPVAVTTGAELRARPRRGARAALALAAVLLAARASGEAPARPPEPKGTALVSLGAELGGAPLWYGVKAGGGYRDPPRERRARSGFMLWLEADRTGEFTPRWEGVARAGRMTWLYPHVEASREVVAGTPIFAWFHAGPTFGWYGAGGDEASFRGFGAGLGLRWTYLRLGFRYHGQWATFSAGGQRVVLQPMALVSAGLELPLASWSVGR